jgi:hypothetical protein
MLEHGEKVARLSTRPPCDPKQAFVHPTFRLTKFDTENFDATLRATHDPLPLPLLSIDAHLRLPLTNKRARAHPDLKSLGDKKMILTQRGRTRAPELKGDRGWLNTDRPLTLANLRGKFVLLDFWTYGCINCIHIIPELKKLEAKYPNNSS